MDADRTYYFEPEKKRATKKIIEEVESFIAEIFGKPCDAML